MPIFRSRLFLPALCALPMLSACASDPTPDYRFYTEPGPSGLRFTLVHFNHDAAEPTNQPAAQSSRPDKGQGQRRGKGQRPDAAQRERESAPVPNSSVADSELLALLEQELDQRSLCPDGYRIDQWRPTQRGVLLQGQCR
ncbi:hypothetical protein KUV89_07550 [Marinobacter hydrocarbonoclasticus]|nr:hypothetical protein [Marinobacter nauticus]